MSVETMRWLDRWLGVPLCFLFSCGVFWRRRARSGALPKRLLCIQLAEMGSWVLAAPTVHWLKSRGVACCFVSFAANGECLHAAGLASSGNTYLWRTTSPWFFCLDFARFLVWSWKQGFDATIDFEPCSRFSALLGLLAGARLRSGFRHPGSYRGRLHNRPVPYREDQHMSANFLALAAALIPGGAVPEAWQAESDWRGSLDPLAWHHPGVWESIWRAGGLPVGGEVPLILLNPNAGDLLPQRRWPAGNFVELARRLLAHDPTLHVGVLGAPWEMPRVDALVAEVDSARCVSFAGQVEVATLPILISRARLLVSNDSGPAHMAALTTTPTIVLFGPETPRLYQPLGNPRIIHAALPCSPCIRPANQRRSTCKDNLCMKAIAVDSVFGEAVSILATSPAQTCKDGDVEGERQTFDCSR